MNEEFLISLNTERGKDYFQSKEYIIDYVNYMIEIIKQFLTKSHFSPSQNILDDKKSNISVLISINS